MIGRFGMICTWLLLSGCGGGMLAVSSECATPGACSAEQQSSESFTGSASTACADGIDCPFGEGAEIGLSVPSMAEDQPTHPMPTNASLDQLPSTNQPSPIESPDPVHEAIPLFPGERVGEASDLQILTSGLFESVGVQPDDVPEILSLMLDGVILDTLGGAANPSLLGLQREEVPGRFPTFLELLCREQGSSDSDCRQRYGR